MAGSYLNGQVVDSLGGGICQVSTTLYNAVLLSELDVTERHCHSMIIGYVKPSMDAAIAESSGKNFRFVNSTAYPIYIDGHTTAEKQITFTIYGVESRPASHRVTYESEVLETNVPETDAIYADAGRPAGYSSGIQSAHIGYKARLWRNTYEDGVLTSRDEVNSSTYKMSPRSITIGVATDNPDIYNYLMEAAGSGSADVAAGAAAQAAAILNPAPPEEVPVQ
jgi:vancomycin resistance protein YoaR